MPPVLQLKQLSKAFGATVALRDVSFELHAGEVHALVGENGAGKSTLIKIITGAYRPDSGQVEIDGRPVTNFDPVVAKRLGVAVVYQQPTLFPDLSVAENLAFGVEPSHPWRIVRWSERARRAQELLARIGSDISPSVEAGSLSMPEQQLVEIARAIGQNARILIMDEPTAALSSREVEHLFTVIRQLRRDGVGLLYVSHRLEELPLIADRVSVLRDGAWVATRPIKESSRSELIRLMVGRDIATVFPKRPVVIGNPRLEVERLSASANGIHDVSLAVRSGEILGLAGLMGAGRSELAQVLFGLSPAHSGRIVVDGRSVIIDGPIRAIESGIAYVPEDRRQHGVIPEMSIAANTSLALLECQPVRRPDDKLPARQKDGDRSRARVTTVTGSINADVEHNLALQMVAELRIKAASVSSTVDSLSGGNQQKVALARWLATDPRVLILDEPTQGVDVGAKSEIYRLIMQLADQGMAIILISSELPELLGMCDRIAVMRKGTISGTLTIADATAESILALAIG